jgi:hypothetical protein
VKNVNHVPNAKPANCASLWTPKLNRSLKKQITARHRAQNVQPAHRVKNVNHALRVKNVSLVKLLPQKLQQPMKKHCLTMSNCWMTSKTVTMASVHVAAHAVNAVAATVASVKAMPTAT